jgi:hypothetical protein
MPLTFNSCNNVQLFNLTEEPSVLQCFPAFQRQVNTTSICQYSRVTWGCWSVLSMSVISCITLIAILSMGCLRIVREGTIWIQVIYIATVIQGLLYSIRYLFVANDILVIAATTIESQVVVITAFILCSICNQLYDDESSQAKACFVSSLLAFMSVCLIMTFILSAFTEILGNSNNCHQAAWILLSCFRVVCVINCAIAAGFIQKKMNQVVVSESYRKSKTRTLWFVAVIFLVAAAVALANDIFGVLETSSTSVPNVSETCWKWASVSVDLNTENNSAVMLTLRILVRTVKFFLPMWTVMIFFKALMPERQVRDRNISWASGVGGQDDEWSTISGYQPPQTSPFDGTGRKDGSGSHLYEEPPSNGRMDIVGMLRSNGGGINSTTKATVIASSTTSPPRLFGGVTDLLRSSE